MAKTLAEMADEVLEWATAKGWEPDEGRTFGDEVALLHSEASEALEAFREVGFEERHVVVHVPDPNHVGHTITLLKPDDVASEFADILIRLLHYGKRRGFDLEAEFERKMAYNWTRAFRHGGKAL